MLVDSGITVTRSDKFLIKGAQDVEGFNAVARGGAVDVPLVKKNMRAFVQDILERERANPVKIILLECAEMPPYADAIRQVSGLPTFDVISLIDFFHSATDDATWNSAGFPPQFPEFWKTQFTKDGSLTQEGVKQGMFKKQVAASRS